MIKAQLVTARWQRGISWLKCQCVCVCVWYETLQFLCCLSERAQHCSWPLSCFLSPFLTFSPLSSFSPCPCFDSQSSNYLGSSLLVRALPGALYQPEITMNLQRPLQANPQKCLASILRWPIVRCLVCCLHNWEDLINIHNYPLELD